MKKLFCLLAGAVLIAGCAAYKTPTLSYLPKSQDDNTYELKKKALESKLYTCIPRHREQIKFYDLPHWMGWTLLGNEDDGIFGEDSNSPYSTNINFATFAKWQLRNPGHNLTSYIIGSAGRKKHSNFSVFDINDKNSRAFYNRADGAFSGERYGFKLQFNDFKPFFSAHFPSSKNKEFQLYLGWRPEGRFGIKLRPAAKKKK